MSSRRKRKAVEVIEEPEVVGKAEVEEVEYESYYIPKKPVLVEESTIKENHISQMGLQDCLTLSTKCLQRLHQLELQLGASLSGLAGGILDGKAIGKTEEEQGHKDTVKDDKEDDEVDGVKRMWTEEELKVYDVPENCVPIRADVRHFDWEKLASETQFEVIMMDPPWVLATANPTRGVALGYGQLKDDDISSIPVKTLQQKGGYLFIWVINSRFEWTINQMHTWGYHVVDTIDWVKMTVNRRLAKGHGFYLQHAKETCIVGRKGDVEGAFTGVVPDTIITERRGQSQKPTEIYDMVEKLVPNGRYLEIFARRNNLRDYWVSIGLEL